MKIIPVLKERLVTMQAKIIAVVLLCSVICGIIYGSYDNTRRKKLLKNTSSSSGITSVIVESSEIRDTIDCLGQIVFREKATISSKVNGRLARINIKEGQRVTKGEIIAEIERLPFEIALKQQKSELEIARKALELADAKYNDAMKGVEIKLKTIKKAEAELRDKKAIFDNMENILRNKTELYRAGGISRTEYESVKTQHNTLKTDYEVASSDLEIQLVGYRDRDITGAGYKVPSSDTERVKILKIINTRIEKAEVESAGAKVKQTEDSLLSTQLMLNETYIRSPLTGVVAVRSMETGEMVREDSVIATVMDISRVYVSINLGEKEVQRVSKSQKITFTVDALPEKKFTAAVDTITPVLDTKTRTFEVRAIAENRGMKLLPGMFSRAVIDTGKTVKGILIPLSAVIRGDDNRTEVYIVRNNMLVRKNIVTGNETGGQVQVLEGLGEGDRIVVTGINSVYQGMKFDK